MSLIVTGTIGIDSVYTPTGKAEKVLGGSCTYFAAAASFYTPVRLVAAVGGDLSKQHRAVLKKFKGIDDSGLEVRPKSRTFAWGGEYSADMNSRKTLFTELGVLAEAPPKVPAHFADSRFVFLANSHPAVQLDLLSQLPARQLAVADTMDLWISTARPELEKLLNQVDGLVLNYDEAELYTGRKNPVTAARQMLNDHRNGRRGLKFVVVKKGEHGAIIVHRDAIAALPAYPAEKVIDPTGAGDTFAGGMMGYLAATVQKRKLRNPTDFALLQTAIAHGTVVASFNIESFTLSRLLKLKKPELAKRYKEFAGIVRV
jgi:cytidine kinase